MPESVTKDSLEIQYPPSIVEDVTKLVQRVQTFTGATGAAIALRDGEEMVCRASRGNNAPDVGMMMNLDGTFAGLAVKSMKAVRCDDAETDPRVDSEVSRALRIKSMACVPVLSGMRVSGVIAVFSGTGSAFSDTHMAVLKTMADGLGANIQRYHESHGGSTAAIAAPVATPKPPAPATPPPAAKIEAPKVEAVAPAPAPMAAAAAAAAPAPSAAPAPAVEKPKKQESKQGKWKPVAAPKQEEETPVVEAKAEVRPEPKPVKEETKAAVAAAPSFSYETPAAEGSKKGLVIGGVAAAVLVIAAAGYMMMGRGSKTSTAPSTPATTQSAPSSSSTSSAAPVATTTAPAANTTASTTKPQDTTKPSAVALDKTRVLTPQGGETKPAAAPMVVAPAANKPAQQQSAEEAPPSINIAGGTGPALDIPMTTSAPKLTAPAPANATIVPSRLLQRVNPSYPQAAKQYRIEGAVSLNATIGADGHVKDAKVVSGPPMLRDAAANAVRQWKYAPSTVNGRAVESTVQVVLQFKMPN